MMVVSHPEFAEALNTSARAKGGLFLISEVWRLLVLCLVPAICDFQALLADAAVFLCKETVEPVESLDSFPGPSWGGP